VRCCTYLIPLPLFVPVIFFKLGFLGNEVNLSHLQNHLQSTIPELPLQMNEDDIPVSTLVVKPRIPRALLPWRERARFSHDHRVAA